MASVGDITRKLNDLPGTGFADLLKDILLTDIPALTQTLTNKTITGSLTGDVTGNVTGGLTGPLVVLPSVTVSTTGPTAIDLTTTNILHLTGATAAAAATIAAPIAGSLLYVHHIDSTNDATLTLLAGTFDGTNEIATFETAEDALLLIGLSATRFHVLVNIGAVALSTAA